MNTSKVLFLATSLCYTIAVYGQTINGHEYVDLGLSVRWATCNVGANSPEENGDYYAWGETTTKTSFTEDNSKTYGKSVGNISGNSTYDGARANWGGSWRIPTDVEYQELLDNCDFTWTTLDGKKGYKVKSKKNSRFIFLPVSYDNVNDWGGYWLSTPCADNSERAKCFGLDANGHDFGTANRCGGLFIRPVSD